MRSMLRGVRSSRNFASSTRKNPTGEKSIAQSFESRVQVRARHVDPIARTHGHDFNVAIEPGAEARGRIFRALRQLAPQGTEGLARSGLLGVDFHQRGTF